MSNIWSNRLHDITGQNLNQIWPHLGSSGQKTILKQAKTILSGGTETFEN